MAGPVGSPTNSPNPTPQLPGTVDFAAPKEQPGNTKGSAPNIPQQNPPNVNGGPASFSDLTQSIADLTQAKTAELAASKDAFIANTQIDKVTAEQVSNLSSGTLDALSNIQRAERLPDGAQGELAGIIGLFDKRYNYNYQKTQMQTNEAKAAQVTATAQALKNQNNALPAIMGKVSEAQKVIFDAQKDANTLALEGIKVNSEVQRTKIEGLRLGIEMGRARREQTEFQIKSMSTSQLETAYKQAQTGKGPFAGIGGLIESRLISEKSAMTALDSATLALKKGNREDYNDSLTDFVSHLPRDVTAQAIAAASAKKSPVVEFPTGQTGPDGKPQILQIPYNLAQNGLVSSIKSDELANKALAADYSQRLNINGNIQQILKTGNAFAGVDQRATMVVTNLGSIMKNFDPKDPQSVRQVGLLLEENKKQMEGIAADHAKTYDTKQASAAVENYGKTGQFDAQGGTAVMSSSGGVPSLTRNSRYAPMWEAYNRQIAAEIGREHLVNAPSVNSSSDAMTILAAMQAKPQGKETINKISENILADPNKVKPLADAMKNTMQSSGVNGVFTQLAHEKGANPLWQQMLQHPDDFKTDVTDAKGNVIGRKVDPSKMFDAMEKATITAKAAGNAAADYSATFLAALRNYAASADDNSASDPSYSVQDHAAEAAIFGGNPVGTVLGDLHYNLRTLATRARQEMQQRIQKDVTGQTQKEAMAAISGPGSNEWLDALTGPAGIAYDFAARKIFAKTGQDPNSVPSATGTGLTASQVRKIYSGGQ